LVIPWAGLISTLVFAGFLWLYRDVLAGLLRQWIDDDNYTHGLLIPPIAFFLLYRTLDKIPDHRQARLRSALPLLLPGLLLFFTGQAAAELFTLRISMLLVFWGLVRGIWGRITFRRLCFPLLFLIFMIPLPYVVFYRIAFPLQLASTALSAGVLEWLGVPLVRTGNIIHLRWVSLDVVTACSGLRSLLALICFGTLAAGMFADKWRHRILIVLLAPPIAMASNTLRIVLTAALVHGSGRSFLEGGLHQALGFLTFALGVALIFTLGGRFGWQRKSV
jgi:exosortase